MPQTDKLVTVTQYIADLLEGDKAALGLEDVWYGDQEKIPRTPAAAVEPGDKTRDLQGAPFRTLNTMKVFILVYIAKVQDVQVTRKEADTKAELIETKLHTDKTMGGNVIHGHCTSVETGYAVRAGTLMRAARITWEGVSKTQI